MKPHDSTLNQLLLLCVLVLTRLSCCLGGGLAVPAVKSKGLLTVSGMKVSNAGPQGSLVHFGQGAEYSVGSDAAGNFIVQHAASPAPLLSLVDGTLHANTARLDAQALNVAGDLTIGGVAQWRLVSSEDFSAQGVGWSCADVSQCAGISMLGGFCKFGQGEVTKTFSGLPPHKQLRVVANYHFIDRWIGESGYLKLNIGQGGGAVPVWSEQHTQAEAKHGLSLCGQEATPEGKFSVPIDISVPHHEDSVAVTVGSTMDSSDPCDESWGISGFELWTRN